VDCGASPQNQLGGCFAAQSDFGSVNAENARIAAGRTQCSYDRRAREESQLHKALSDIGGKIDPVQYALLTLFQFRKRSRRFAIAPLRFETQLHYAPSMESSRVACQDALR